jgi:predicted neutral ceramidase superfamily lipid hydrolase
MIKLNNQNKREGEKIEITTNKLTLIIPISILAFIFILNLYFEMMLPQLISDLSLNEVLLLNFGLLLSCLFIMVIASIVELITGSMRKWFERKIKW